MFIFKKKIGSKRASNVQSIAREVHNAGGQKCECQNLSICYIFWKLFHPTMDQSRNSIWKEKTISLVQGLCRNLQIPLEVQPTIISTRRTNKITFLHSQFLMYRFIATYWESNAGYFRKIYQSPAHNID